MYNHLAFNTIKQKDGSWLLAPKNKGYKIESTVLIRNSNLVPERKWLLKKDPRQVRIYYNNLAAGDFKLEINLSGYGGLKKEVVNILVKEMK
ncbi:MAG: hypothetical protein IPL55_00340 [Saprospiraceae bacterium]|nr:hypothetical protein [Saprospiraceae bacterium]